jgi:transposase
MQMMGQQAGVQDQLFYSFNLEAHVPAEHLLRGIDRFPNLSELRRHLAPFCSHTGRPSIDPELMVRMLLIGYCFGIHRSGGHARRFISISPIAGSAVWS